MSPIIYFVAHLYPWWGIPLALIFAELANYYRRHRNRKRMFISLGVSGFFTALAIAYFVFNGLVYLPPAMQNIENKFSDK